MMTTSDRTHNQKSEYTEAEFEKTVDTLKTLKTNNRAAEGKLLTEAKERTQHGKFGELLERTGISQKEANVSMKVYRQFGDDIENNVIPANLIIEIAKSKPEHIDILEETLKDVYEHDEDANVSLKGIRDARRYLTDSLADEIGINELVGVVKREISEEQREEQEAKFKAEREESSRSSFAYYLMKAARACNYADASAQELADLIVFEKGDRANLELLKRKLEIIYKIHEID